VRQIVRVMHGTIAGDSTQGVGMVFRVTLPSRSAEALA
jgi:signal transduction histidine kinase